MSDVVDMPRMNVPPPLELVKGRIEEVLPPEASAEIGSGGTVVVDVRDPERFEAGHVDGALNVSSGEGARNAHDPEFATAIEEAAGGKDKRLLLFCGEGNRSARTADALANEHGFARVASVIGGVKLWDELGYPVEGEVVVGDEDAETGLEGDAN